MVFCGCASGEYSHPSGSVHTFYSTTQNSNRTCGVALPEGGIAALLLQSETGGLRRSNGVAAAVAAATTTAATAGSAVLAFSGVIDDPEVSDAAAQRQQQSQPAPIAADNDVQLARLSRVHRWVIGCVFWYVLYGNQY